MHVVGMREKRNPCRGLVGNSKGNRQPKITSNRCENNIEINIKSRNLEVVDWNNLLQDRENWQAFSECVNEIPVSIKCQESPDCLRSITFQSRTQLYGVNKLRACTNRQVAGSIPAGVSRFFIDIKSFRSHYGPGVDSVSNRNEYQEYFLGGEGGRCVRLSTLPTSRAVVTKSRNLNFLEPSGPFQACNGTALPLPVLNSRASMMQISMFGRVECLRGGLRSEERVVQY